MDVIRQYSARYTIVVYMQIVVVVPRSPVESFKLWLEQFSFMKEGCDIFLETDLLKKWFAFRRATLILLEKNTLVRCILSSKFES